MTQFGGSEPHAGLPRAVEVARFAVSIGASDGRGKERARERRLVLPGTSIAAVRRWQ